MDHEKFQKKWTEFNAKREDILVRKSADYATEDILSNFKRVNVLCSILGIDTSKSPVYCALYLCVHKLDRFTNLLRDSKEPMNESIEDTLVDLHNYLDHAFMLLEEQNEKIKR